MKKLKTAGMALIMAVSICGLTACGGKDRETEQPIEAEESGASENEAELAAEDEAASETDMAMETDGESTEPEEEGAESEEETAEEIAPITESVEFTPVAGLSETYADLENRCFAYDGKIYTLGESTLQDLIDGGIPFDEDELNNAGNNVNSNYETDRYTVDINNYASMQFSFINITESNLTEAECLLSLVRWCPLYVPQAEYEDSMNEEIISSINDAASHVCFSFPLTLTKEQLLENSSDATEVDEYNNVRYRIDSDVYMGDSGYSFKFNKKTNQLEDINISWLP